MKKVLSTFIVLWVIWVLLAGFHVSELIVGAVASLILAFVISNHVDYAFDGSLPIKLVKFLVLYLPLFIYQMILSNLDMAYRVLSPSLPIKPGFVKIPTTIKSPVGKLILANSITLTPGTLSLDADDDYVYIHWVNVEGEDVEAHKRHVSQGFENVLGGIFK